jgi:Cdc6-like AAA superfamily ATPase
MVNRKQKKPSTSTKKVKKISRSKVVSLRTIDEMDVDDELLYDTRKEEEEYDYDDEDSMDSNLEDFRRDNKASQKNASNNIKSNSSNKKANNNEPVVKEKRLHKIRRRMIIEEEDEMDLCSENKGDSEDYLLPCREKEQEEIYKYIKSGFDTQGSYSALYISGMPGTGKTASVTNIINKLRRECENNIVPKFNVLYLNGMKIVSPNNVYKILYEEIYSEKKHIGALKCLSLLEEFFKHRKTDTRINLNYLNNTHLVLVIDEIDCLVTKKQAVLYNLFNWTTYTQSKLIIIAISNTLDLPEKLPPKIASRIGNKRLIFKPYQTDELMKILSTKVNTNIFSEDAIRMSSMKVASVNGDLRRILQICKRAEEIFESERQNNIKKPKKIEITHIQKACLDLFDSKVVNVIKHLKLYEKIILLSILFEMKISMDNRVSLLKLYDRQKFFCIKYCEADIYKYKLSFEEFKRVIYGLVKLRIINFTDNNSENFLSNNVFIKFYADEFINALYDDKEFNKLIEDHLNK